jgi:hypothetical protein
MPRALLHAARSTQHAARSTQHAALALCKKAGAILLIAKLDRLARNTHFITGLMPLQDTSTGAGAHRAPMQESPQDLTNDAGAADQRRRYRAGRACSGMRRPIGDRR